MISCATLVIVTSTTRRSFLSIASLALPGITKAAAKPPSIAITMDDVNWKVIPQPYGSTAGARILDALAQHGDLKAALFAVGQHVDNDGGHAVLDAWNRAGHLLGNHTWSHKSYGSTTDPAWFEADVLKNEALLQRWPNYRKLFRFPLLKEGRTVQARDEMRHFLAEHGYRNGHVTIDASDWYYDQRLRERLKAEPGFAVERFREPYLKHLWDRAGYYNRLSTQVLGRSIPHTILVHYNLLNSLFLGDVLTMFRNRGWELRSPVDTYKDPVYLSQPKTAPAGESLVWALAKETGRFDAELRYPGEDDVYEKPILDGLGL